MTDAAFRNLRGKTIVVVGLAQTGIAVAKFCARRGARVVVTDGKPADQLAGPIAQLAGVPCVELEVVPSTFPPRISS
jgi:UDP-N-acetylmuramoylalanine--D-glutamate ligase